MVVLESGLSFTGQTGFFYFFLREGIISIMMFRNVECKLSGSTESAFFGALRLTPSLVKALWSGRVPAAPHFLDIT